MTCPKLSTIQHFVIARSVTQEKERLLQQKPPRKQYNIANLLHWHGNGHAPPKYKFEILPGRD